MSVIDTIKKVTLGRIPYNYKIGSPSSGKPLPFDVKLSIDKDFNKAVTKWVTIGSIGVGLGILAGIVISKNKK